MRALIKYQTRKHLLSLCLDFLMAENQRPENTTTMEEVEAPQLQQLQKLRRKKQYQKTPVPFIEKPTPELTESPEMVAALAVELTTALCGDGSLGESDQGSFQILEPISTSWPRAL